MSTPTIESLHAENADLRRELEETRENARELADLLESYGTAEEGVHASAKEMAKLKGVMRTIEIQRDTAYTTCNELKREVKALRRRLGKEATG